VLSWQEQTDDCFAKVRERLRSPSRAVRQHGSDFLAYALVDAVVDSYFPVVNQLGDELENVEDQLVRPDELGTLMHDILKLRSDIRTLRRVAWAHREMIREWMAYDGRLLSQSTQIHLRDVSDHTIRLVELLDSCREMCTDLRDLHMSATSMRMNEVMKVLTVIATIFIPLGFIAGLYGMNFATDASPWNMPETRWYLGYPFALLLMATVAGAMLYYFRLKGWIGRPR
jgi:magnesium transporter